MYQEFMQSSQSPDVMGSLITYISDMITESIDPAGVTVSNPQPSSPGLDLAQHHEIKQEFGIVESVSSKVKKEVEEDDSFLHQPGQSSEDIESEVSCVFDKWPAIEIIQKHLDEESKCTLCQGSYELNGKAIELPCKHFFHNECLQFWVQNKYKCPSCKYVLNSDVESVTSEDKVSNNADILGDLVNELFLVY